MSQAIIGDRVPDFSMKPHQLKPGEYGRCAPDGDWYGIPPGTAVLANFAGHDITEHDDGTVTVAPSILVGRCHQVDWHGFLERGEWRPC